MTTRRPGLPFPASIPGPGDYDGSGKTEAAGYLAAFSDEGPGGGSPNAFVMGEPDALDFLFTPESTAKKSKAGDDSTAG